MRTSVNPPALLDSRKIIHVDMDAFYSSVEQLDHPELKGRPVVVGGSPESRGVVAAASYEARKFGIRSAMSCKKAYRLCPHAVFVYPNFKRYKEISDQVREIFFSVTPLVEPLSLDEAYLDVTSNLLDEPLAQKVALHVKDEIFKKTGLTASAGVGPNKFIAKIASDLKKPNGLVVIPPSKMISFIETLPIEKMWSVGPVTAEKLYSMNIKTAGDLKKRSIQEIKNALGKHGLFLHELANGIDHREVEPFWESKSRGSETTFEKDIHNIEDLLDILKEQADEVASSLQEEKLFAHTLTIKVRYNDFKTITRSRTSSMPTNQSDSFFKTAQSLLLENTEAGKRSIRLVGLSASNFLQEEEPHQLWLPFID